MGKKYNFSLLDYEETCKLRNTYANMRLVALGTVFTLMSAIVAYSKDTTYPETLIIHSVLLLLVYTGIRIISALNRGLYVFIVHSRNIEKELKVTGFSSKWMNYISIGNNTKNNRIKDSGSYAFVVASQAMNFVVSAIIISDLAIQIKNGFNLAFIPLILTVIIFLNNYCHISSQLDPNGFLEDIIDSW